MGDAIRAAMAGVEPPPPPPGADRTMATSVLSLPSDTISHGVPAPAPARPAREVAAPPRPGPARHAPPPPRRRSRAGPALVVVLLLAAGGIGAVVAADQLSGDPKLRRVIYDDFNRSVDELRALIDDNTR